MRLTLSICIVALCAALLWSTHVRIERNRALEAQSISRAAELCGKWGPVLAYAWSQDRKRLFAQCARGLVAVEMLP